MPVEQRIDAMEAAIEVLSKKPTPPPANANSGQPPIIKPEGTPPGPPPDERKKPLTFVEKQQKEGFKQKLLQRGNYSAIADKLYKKE